MFKSDCYNYACTFSVWLQLTPQWPPFGSNLFAEPPLYAEFDHRGPQKGRANSDIEHRIFVYINTGR